MLVPFENLCVGVAVMNNITVAVHGALGRMGREVISAVSADAGLSLVGGADIKAIHDYLLLPDGSGQAPLFKDLTMLLQSCRPQVIVDFSLAGPALAAARTAIAGGVNLVVGTTGLTDENLAEIDRLAAERGVGVVIAPNFAIGAVLMMYLSKIAARYFDSAEIIELHHNEKQDAPSGTALATARAMRESRGKPFDYAQTAKETLSGTRGGEVEGIAIHSVRLPGLVANQEVILGAKGQTLRIRHETLGRECFMPGVIMAIKEVVKIKGLAYGLDKLLNLGDDNEDL